MNKSFLLLVLGGLRSQKAFDLKFVMVAGLVMCEEALAKLSPVDKVFIMANALSNPSAPEAEYTRRIINAWDKIFPDYILMDQEVILKDGDRLDILAKAKDGRPVIIEVKSYAKSAHKQLRSYAVHYNNPILVNITPAMPKNRVDDVEYIIFKDS